MDGFLGLVILAVVCTSVSSQEDDRAPCLTKVTLEVESTCPEYSFKAEEYERFNATLRKEIAENSVLDTEWKQAKVGDGDEYGLSVLTTEEFQAIKVFTPAATNKVYKDYVEQLEQHGSVTAADFKFKGLHYFLSSAFEKLAAVRGTRRRVIYMGLKEVDARHVKCEARNKMRNGTMTNFAGFGVGFRDLGRAESQALEGGTIFEVSSANNVDISGFTDNRHEEDLMVSPCESFEVIAKIERTGDNGKKSNVIKMSSPPTTGSGSRVTSLGVLSGLVALCALMYLM